MNPVISILYGGTSDEREVSLKSGENVAQALSAFFDVRLIDVKSDELPVELLNAETLVFSVLHGGFGEGGGMQALLEAEGIPYVGSNSASSKLCMHKVNTKQVLNDCGVPVLPHVTFESGNQVDFSFFNDDDSTFVIKPDNEGSSIGLHLVDSKEAVLDLLPTLGRRTWIIEKRIQHREFTVGIVDGKSMGVVEISPKNHGVYDYAHKYTPGAVEFLFPASISDSSADKMREFSRIAYEACGCRDLARADIVMDDEENIYFLEINTIPGLTKNSLLPMSAKCMGYEFPALCKQLIDLGLKRYYEYKNMVVQ